MGLGIGDWLVMAPGGQPEEWFPGGNLNGMEGAVFFSLWGWWWFAVGLVDGWVDGWMDDAMRCFFFPCPQRCDGMYAFLLRGSALGDGACWLDGLFCQCARSTECRPECDVGCSVCEHMDRQRQTGCPEAVRQVWFINAPSQEIGFATGD